MSSNPSETEPSWIKIRNEVIINVCSAVGTAASLAILTALLSGLALLAQWLFHYIVIPTNLLVALLFIGIGILIVLLVIAGAIALFHRWLGKHPGVAFAILFGFIGALIALSLEKSSTSQKFWEDLNKAVEGVKTQAAQQPASPPQP